MKENNVNQQVMLSDTPQGVQVKTRLKSGFKFWSFR